ncbi:MAG: hypothetical protein ACERKZ_21880 [Lachnotalea sp.]
MNKKDEQKILDQINIYADQVLKGMNLETTPISIQLDKLKPKMESLAKKYSLSLEDIFVMYMDLNLINQKKQDDELNTKLNLN